MLYWLGGILYRWRKTLLPLALLLVLAMAWYGSSVFGTVRTMGMTDPNSESARAQELITTRFPQLSADITLLLSSSALKATDPEFSQAATELLETLKGRDEVASVTSYYETENTALLSRDRHETLVLVTLEEDGDEGKHHQYDQVKSLLQAPPLRVDIGGSLIADIQFNEQLHADLLQAELIGLPIVAVLLVIIFGGLVAALLPLLVGGVVIAGAFAIVRVLATFIEVSSFATNVITIIGLGLAIDYSLFLVTRFREELEHNGDDVRGALQRTMATAGRTVLFSGLTVGTSLIALLLFPQVMLRSIGLAIIAVALIAMLATLTVLPIVLALLGHRVNALSLLRLFGRRRTPKPVQQGGWYRLTYWVMRRAVLVASLTILFLLMLGYPFLHAKFALPDYRSLPTGTSARDVADRIDRNFEGQNTTKIDVVLHMKGEVLDADNLAALDTYVGQLDALPHVTSVQSLVSLDERLTLEQYQQLYRNPAVNPQLQGAAEQLADKDVTRIIVETDLKADNPAAKDLVRDMRAVQAPASSDALVGGAVAEELDQFTSLEATIPYALPVMIGAILLLLFLMTGSVIMPIKAVLLNILSLSATFGTLVWIFQDGNLQDLLGFQSTGSLDATQPVLIFAIAFGLSMDYEVFLLSRVKEIYDQTGDNTESVAQGLQRTGGLITSAALLLAVVVGTFAASKIIYIKEIGLGVALAIVMDATLVRGLLVPSMMRLLGNWNWWAPAPLQKLWRYVGLSETSSTEATHERSEKENVEVTAGSQR